MNFIKINKLVFSMIAGCILTIALPINSARADYLVRVVPVAYAAPGVVYAAPTAYRGCVRCSCGRWRCYNKRHVHKRLPVKHKYRHYQRARCYTASCASPCYRRPCAPQPDFVTFYNGPAPAVRGARWVSPCQYDYPYDPDMSTGDDDPVVYPGMDIDR